MKMVNKRIAVPVTFAVLGLALIVAGGVLIYGFKVLIHNQIKDRLVLKNGTDTYDDWITPPVPVFYQIYVLDLQNKDEVINGAKPVLKEVGPFTYDEEQVKVDIKFHDNGTVSYREIKTYVFNRSMSVGDEDITVITPNLLYISVVDILKDESSLIQDALNGMFEVAGEEIFMNLTVGDLLWGYTDPLLGKLEDLAKAFNFTFDVPDKLGLFYGKNETDDGVYTVYSGQNDTSSQFSLIDNWNGGANLNYWSDSYANMINGSDGTSFPPFEDSTDKLYLFSTDLCRSIYVTYNYVRELRGIDLRHYTPPPDLFTSYPDNPDNRGFCTPIDNCLPSGLLDISSCRKGLPIVLSLPHFLYADPSIIDSVIGFAPNELEHNTVIGVEPNTGVVMNAAKRIQLNIRIYNDSHYTSTEKIRPMYYPIIWLNESATLNDDTANKFKDEVQTPIMITQAVQYGLIGIGAFILICFTIYLVKRRVTKPEYEDSKPILGNHVTA